VPVDDRVGLPAAARHGDWHQLVGEASLVVGRDGPLLRTYGELVLLLARDGVVAAQILSRLEHASGHRVVPPTGRLAGPVEAVHQLDAALADAGPEPYCVVPDVRHRLRPAGHDEARCAGRHLPRGIEHGLKARPTPSVDLQAGHAGAETGVERGDPADRGVLAAGVAVAEKDVIDVALAEPRPADHPA